MSQLHILQVFILIGAAQGFLLAISVFKRSSRENHNWLLALALLALAFRLTIYPFKSVFDTNAWQFVANFSLISLLLVGPALFLFIYFKTATRHLLKWHHSWHLIPFAIYLVHTLWPVFPLPLCYSYATLFSGTVYGLLSISRLVFFKGANNGLVTFALNRSRLYSIALPLLIIPVLIFSLVDVSYSVLGFHPATLPYLGLTVLLYRMGYKSASDSVGFYKHLLHFEHYEKREIDTERLEKLINLVEGQKLYRDQQLTIQSLSVKSGLTRHEISELVNKGLKKSFNEFINAYRVEDAKQKLMNEEYAYLSIAGIGQEAGFKSRSNFNHAFKHLTGMTPSEFKLNQDQK